MKRVLATLFFLLFSFDLSVSARAWETLEGCRLVRSSMNDGDSFLVRHQGTNYVFRIFFVDAPETDTLIPERVAAQAAYFNITFDQALQVGEEATEFARRFLSGSFTVHTDWSDGWGRMKRYRAIIEKDGQDLALALVEKGLGRVSGFIPDSPWPSWNRSVREFRRELSRAEERAKRNRVGAWRFSDENRSRRDAIEQHEPESEEERKLEINQASAQDLQRLPGIGPVLSQRIVDGRPYRELTDLLFIRGISTRILENMLPHVYLDPPPLHPYTADYYRANLRFYLNDEIRIHIRELAPTDRHAPEGFQVREAVTYHDTDFGGRILLYAPEDKMRNALARFENNTEPITVYAWLRDYEGEPILIVP